MKTSPGVGESRATSARLETARSLTELEGEATLVDPELHDVLDELLEGVLLSHDAYWLIENLEEQARYLGFSET